MCNIRHSQQNKKQLAATQSHTSQRGIVNLIYKKMFYLYFFYTFVDCLMYMKKPLNRSKQTFLI